MGRLFDGVASLLGVRHHVSYEAQAAIELEALARTATRAVPLLMPVAPGRLQHRDLVRALVDGIRSGLPRADLALGFHRAVVAATTRLAVQTALAHDTSTVGLTGGVFQNRIVLTELSAAIRAAGLTVLTHRRVPPNDGGLCLGQAVVAQARIAGVPTEAAAGQGGAR
jgi:hydrogenase maturation protein HypF